jgi:hypothetical protein
MLLMRPASITRAIGRGLGPGNQVFLGPVKLNRADRRVPFGAQKTPCGRFQGPYCGGEGAGEKRNLIAQLGPLRC